MNEIIQEYLENYPIEIKELYMNLRALIYETISLEITEKMWAKLPSYYVGESFVRLIPFKDHINVEAKAAIEYKENLAGYKMTPKGMLQIYKNQDIPSDILKHIIEETLIQL